MADLKDIKGEFLFPYIKSTCKMVLKAKLFYREIVKSNIWADWPSTRSTIFKSPKYWKQDLGQNYSSIWDDWRTIWLSLWNGKLPNFCFQTEHRCLQKSYKLATLCIFFSAVKSSLISLTKCSSLFAIQTFKGTIYILCQHTYCHFKVSFVFSNKWKWFQNKELHINLHFTAKHCKW